MSSGMNVEQAKELAKTMTYSEAVYNVKHGKFIKYRKAIHKINGIPHTVECSRCHQHYDYEELRLLGRSKGCIDIPHCPNYGAHLKGEGN